MVQINTKYQGFFIQFESNGILNRYMSPIDPNFHEGHNHTKI